MYLPSCERLAAKEPTLAALIERMDAVIQQAGHRAEILATDIASLVDEVPDVVESLLDELLADDGLRKETRFSCKNGCHHVSPEDLAEAEQEGTEIRCPSCNSRIRDKHPTGVYIAVAGIAIATSSAIPDGRSLRPEVEHPMLFAAADPDIKKSLALGSEWRRIDLRFSQKQCKVQFRRIDKWATTSDDLRRALLDHSPVIVHLLGHGAHKKGLKLHDGTGAVDGTGVLFVPGKVLADLLRHFSCVECVVMNQCYSAEQAEAIAKHVHCVIGMSGEVDDEAAIEFAGAFYDALTAGRSYGTAFQLGVNAIKLKGLTDIDRPAIWLDGLQYAYSLDEL